MTSDTGPAALREALTSLRTDRHPEDNGLTYNDGWNDALDSVLPRLKDVADDLRALAVRPGPSGDARQGDWRHAKWCRWERVTEGGECNCGLDQFRAVAPSDGAGGADGPTKTINSRWYKDSAGGRETDDWAGRFDIEGDPS